MYDLDVMNDSNFMTLCTKGQSSGCKARRVIKLTEKEKGK